MCACVCVPICVCACECMRAYVCVFVCACVLYWSMVTCILTTACGFAVFDVQFFFPRA